MTQLLFDVNVILDVLLERRPHSGVAEALWALAEERRIEAWVPAHAVTTIHYLASRHRDHAFARQVVTDLLTVFRVAPVNDAVLHRALLLACPDFEDAVRAAAAEAVDCGILVSRDPAGFRGSPVEVLDPAAALAWLTAER